MKSLRPHLLIILINLLTVASVKIVLFSCLYAQPTLIHLSLSGSGSQKYAAPVKVAWCSDVTGSKQFVKYGLDSGLLKTRKAGNTEFNGKVAFSADLKKLKHGLKYFYKCGSDKSGWSQVYSFTAEPDNGSFRVGIIGDTQDNANNENFGKTRIITDRIKAFNPSLTLHMGDIVDNGASSESWQNFLEISQELNAGSPLMPVLGNHDVENSKGNNFQEPFLDFYSLFNLPGDEVNYSFTYGNVRFIGIFSGCAQAAAEIDQVKYKAGSPEYIWLEEELTKAEMDKDLGWKIVWMHYPVNSFGWSNISKWKENVLPLLRKHRIDLCLAGHRHVYERYYPLKDGEPVKTLSQSEFNAGDGIIFITNGTAGGNPTGLGGKEIPEVAFTPDRIMYSFAIMDISSDSLTYSVFDQDNNLVDRFILKK